MSCTLEGETAEVTKTTTTKRVFLLNNFQASAIKCLMCAINQHGVRDGCMGFSSLRSFNVCMSCSMFTLFFASIRLII